MRLSSPSGISFDFTKDGHLRRIDHSDVMLNLFLGNGLDASLANLHLRSGGNSMALLGPSSPSKIHASESGYEACGVWRGIAWRVILTLAKDAPAWFWHVEFSNETNATIEADLVLTQDTGLANYGLIRLNEYFVSQYIDHAALTHPRIGPVIVSRQNQPMGGKFPALVTGSLHEAVSFATDALQFTPGTGLPGTVLQHEHALVCLQEKPFTIPPSATVRRGFFSSYLADQPEPTSPADLARVDAALALPEAVFPETSVAPASPLPCSANIFLAPELTCEALTETICATLFPARRHVETDDSGNFLSCFDDNHGHIVSPEKETIVLRPHGHILRGGTSLLPDESALTSTAYIDGVFHSMVTQGHVSINRFLSTTHSYLGLFRSHGLRVFVETDGSWKRLGLPSYFAIHHAACTWQYHHGDLSISVTANAGNQSLGLALHSSAPLRFLVTLHIALNGDDGSAEIPAVTEISGSTARVKAILESDVGRRFPDGCFSVEADGKGLWGDDICLFADKTSRDLPYLTYQSEPAESLAFTIRGHLVAAEKLVEIPASFPFLPHTTPEVSRIAEMLPWFVHNALVHYLSPRGLEQYSGGGWGTRDVCQGAVELLLSLGAHAAIRDLLGRVFAQQNPDGDWPQWFMFFERERSIRPNDSHGDIIYWPLVALGQYLLATGDAAFLDEEIPFFSHDRTLPPVCVRAHVDAALRVIRARVIPGTRLAAYGHGDWNDALQPAKLEMRESLCSSWTVTLNYQMLRTLADAFDVTGENTTELRNEAAAVLADFQRLLIPGGVVTGLAMFDRGEIPRPLLHPEDEETGLSYSLLPMIHAIINDLFTPDQAEHHLALIGKHLTGPDGARLFDKPIRYRGGERSWFQRAETASYFGREIGIMYTHAHLRYAEALARMGRAEEFFYALQQAVPIGIQKIVPSAASRQANCYYSSSDAAFADRYEADENYPGVIAGEVPLEGGWRVYSSGAGITTRLICHVFLGIRAEAGHLVIDPVIPASLDGLTAEVSAGGRRFHVTYRIGVKGHGPSSVFLHSTPLAFERMENPYRTGGVKIPLAALGNQQETTDWLTIHLG